MPRATAFNDLHLSSFPPEIHDKQTTAVLHHRNLLEFALQTIESKSATPGPTTMACSTTFDSQVLVWRHHTRQQNKRKASDVLSISSDSDLSDSPESPPFVFGSKVEESDTSLPGSDPSAIMDGIDCASQMALLHDDADDDPTGDIGTVPIFTEAVRKHAADMHGAKANLTKEAPFNQYGLIAGDVSADMASDSDRRIFYNVSAPSSTFICGSQGSGKSHSLSCLLENCLIHSPAGTLKKALTGIVFHYDTFVADTGGSPCEAACLASHQSLDVRVLCAPTNIVQIKVCRLTQEAVLFS